MITIATPYEVLLKGLEKTTDQQEFCQKKCRFLEGLFEMVLNRGLNMGDAIRWRRTAKGLEDEREVCAEVKVKNYADEEITLLVVLCITNTSHAQVACLRLGGHSGPPKGDDDPRVRELATRIFGEYH